MTDGLTVEQKMKLAKLCGYEPDTDTLPGEVLVTNGNEDEVWSPVEYADQAVEIIESLRKKGWGASVMVPPTCYRVVCYTHDAALEFDFDKTTTEAVYRPTFAEAVCDAALQVIAIMEKDKEANRED